MAKKLNKRELVAEIQAAEEKTLSEGTTEFIVILKELPFCSCGLRKLILKRMKRYTQKHA